MDGIMESDAETELRAWEGCSYAIGPPQLSHGILHEIPA
jgi:hypothetical protein